MNIKPRIQKITLTTGEELFIKVISARQSEEWSIIHADEQHLRARFCQLCLCDASGTSLNLTLEQLLDQPQDAIQQISEAGFQLNYPEKKS